MYFLIAVINQHQLSVIFDFDKTVTSLVTPGTQELLNAFTALDQNNLALSTFFKEILNCEDAFTKSQLLKLAIHPKLELQKSTFFDVGDGSILTISADDDGAVSIQRWIPRKPIDILHGAGLSVSYPAVNRLVENLTVDAVKRLQLAASLEPWFLVISDADDFESGTTTTIGRYLSSVHQIRNTYPRVYLMDLMIDEVQMLQFNNVCRFHLVQELRKNLEGPARCSTPTLELRLVPIKKTEICPLLIMKIDQSTVEGNKTIVEITIEQTLGLDKSWRLDWIVLVTQLFHTQMVLANTILRSYQGSATEQGSLIQLSTMLGRRRIFSENAECHAIDELLRHTFSATVLRLWDVSMETEDPRKLAECGDETAFSDLVMAGVEKSANQHLDPTKT
ncbi:hypothetical protein EDD11_006921 [Mortierella claussenii]|nr:hypothetical protein EDD11_006921 [Mortierella claussenii]